MLACHVRLLYPTLASSTVTAPVQLQVQRDVPLQVGSMKCLDNIRMETIKETTRVLVSLNPAE